jgi:tetratricopeptide (TPR) repeat protein
VDDDAVAARNRLAARFAHAQQAADPSPLLVPAVDEELDLLCGAVDDGLLRGDTSMLLGWTFWYRSTVATTARAESEVANAVRRFIPEFLTRDDQQQFPAPLLPKIAQGAATLSASVLGDSGDRRQTKDLALLIAMMRRILAHLPAMAAERDFCLFALGTALRERYNRQRQPSDLVDAVDVLRQALAVLPFGHPKRGYRLAHFCDALLALNGIGSASDALDEGITLAGEALADAAIPPDARVAAAYSLGSVLLARHQRTNDRADLDNAVRNLESAVAHVIDGQSDHLEAWVMLGVALRIRFAYTENPADLVAAIRLQRAAVDATPAGGPDRFRRLDHLVITLTLGGQTAADTAMLDDVVAIRRHQLDASPPGHPARPLRLKDLAEALHELFLRRGAEPDLDEAIEHQREAVRLSDDTSYLAVLAHLLRTRAERSGALADADEAIELLHKALAVTPEGEQRSNLLALLGTMQVARLRREWSASLADDTVRVLRAALTDLPRADLRLLSHLGATLWERYEHTGAAADLAEAIDTQRRAVAVIPAKHPDRPTYLDNLAFMLGQRYQRGHEARDITEAIDIHRQAADLTPLVHQERTKRLLGLGHSYRARFVLSGAIADRDDAITAFVEAANAVEGPSSDRVVAAHLAGYMLMGIDAVGAADCFRLTVNLLRDVAPRALRRDDQQNQIRLAAGLVPRAAAAALSDPRLSAQQRAERAVLDLESCRGVLLNQYLDARTDLSDLRGTHPALAEDYERLRTVLDEPATPVDARRRAAADLTALAERIRAETPFTTFGRPPAIDDLLAEARFGSIVMVCESESRADALVLTPTGVTLVELEFTHEEFAHQFDAFSRALRNRSGLDSVLEWLWDRVAGPVLEKLEYTQTPEGEWPRLWWMPVGLVGLMPLHAAGHHDDPVDDPGRRAVHDRVVSSYTPTVRALRHARLARPVPQQPLRALIVGVPSVPGVPGRLDCVPEEVAAVRQAFPDGEDFVAPARVPATADVLDELSHHAIAHFACHGTTDAEDPSHSQLLLPGYATDPLTVARITELRAGLGAARLAYLSACWTTVTGQFFLLDEAIHLTSACQLAGYPQVIGTLWEINDAVAPDVATAFYAGLRNPDGHVDISRGAFALNDTIRTLARDYVKVPWLWAAYIHTGC